MLYQKINSKLLIVLVFAISLSWGLVGVVPQAKAAAVAPQYVTACKNFLSDRFCNNELKQSYIDACKAQWASPNKQQWSACIASQAKLTGGTVSGLGAGDLTGKADPALGACKDANDCGLVKKYVNPLINFLSALVGMAVAFSIIWGAIQFSSSAGDPQKTAAAKDRILKALVALVTYVFLYAFLQWLMPGGII
jgi:hypothetical protein